MTNLLHPARRIVLRNSALTAVLFILSSTAGARARQSQTRATPPEQASTRPSKPYLTRDPPAGLTLAANLSERERRENLQALWQIIDVTYAHFKLKSIDWAEVGRRYLARLTAVTSDDDFYMTMFQLVAELKDSHSWLQNYKAPALADVPDIVVETFGGKPYVIAGERAGWEVLAVDGLTPSQKMEALRPYLPGFSSERAFRRAATSSLLGGKDAGSVSVTLSSPDGKVEATSWNRRVSRGRRPMDSKVPLFVTRQRHVNFGRLPSGLGYIQIESFNGREEIDEEFNRALAALRDTPALILDIRKNPGGFGHPRIEGRFFDKRTRVGFSYTKNGARHTDLARREIFIEPFGEWQYLRPVALLVSDVTGSASDLFATELRAAKHVVTIGTTTHGNLSGVAAYAVLPCGLVARISNGYISDAKDRPIETNGNVPDVIVEPSVQDYLNGRDPVLERATQILLRTDGK